MKVNIIGAGIAGLSAGCHLQMKGYDTEIFELHSLPGGLCTSWKKGEYVFDGCLHWLVGSSPSDNFYSLWNELVDMKAIRFYNPEEYFRVEDASGRVIIGWCDAHKLRDELLAKAPEDKAIIEEFIRGILKIARLNMPVDKAMELYTFRDNLRMLRTFLPYLRDFRKYNRITAGEWAARCRNPLLRRFFEFSFMPEMSFLFLLFTFAWMHKKSAGYPVGGSLYFSRLIEQKYLELGGKVNYGSRVSKILTEGETAVGIMLEDGNMHPADIVVSCADGHDTVFGMLEGRFIDKRIRHYYDDFRVFPSYLQVSLGINRTFGNEPGMVYFPIDPPLQVDDSITFDHLFYRLFNFDPTLAPAGKTTMVLMAHTYNYQYWENLRRNDREAYNTAKQDLAHRMITHLEKRFPGIREDIEVIDISSPASVIRYTNNWKGSFEGWLLTQETGMKGLPKTLPGLGNFYMAGQWVEPGGGVPAALLSGRNVAQIIAAGSPAR